MWKTSFDQNDPCYPHFGSDVRIVPGDADGDGKLEIFVPGVLRAGKRELNCVDAATGKAKWRLALPPEKPTDPAVADIDGDGRDECLFTIASTLYSVGALPDGSAGAIEWSLPLPNYTSSVAVADIFGDGKAQIVLSCQDGYVYGIGAAQP